MCGKNFEDEAEERKTLKLKAEDDEEDDDEDDEEDDDDDEIEALLRRFVNGEPLC